MLNSEWVDLCGRSLTDVRPIHQLLIGPQGKWVVSLGGATGATSSKQAHDPPSPTTFQSAVPAASSSPSQSSAPAASSSPPFFAPPEDGRRGSSKVEYAVLDFLRTEPHNSCVATTLGQHLRKVGLRGAIPGEKLLPWLRRLEGVSVTRGQAHDSWIISLDVGRGSPSSSSTSAGTSTAAPRAGGRGSPVNDVGTPDSAELPPNPAIANQSSVRRVSSSWENDEPPTGVEERILSFMRSQPKQRCAATSVGAFVRKEGLLLSTDRGPSKSGMKLLPFLRRMKSLSITPGEAQGTHVISLASTVPPAPPPTAAAAAAAAASPKVTPRPETHAPAPHEKPPPPPSPSNTDFSTKQVEKRIRTFLRTQPHNRCAATEIGQFLRKSGLRESLPSELKLVPFLKCLNDSVLVTEAQGEQGTHIVELNKHRKKQTAEETVPLKTGSLGLERFVKADRLEEETAPLKTGSLGLERQRLLKADRLRELASLGTEVQGKVVKLHSKRGRKGYLSCPAHLPSNMFVFYNADSWREGREEGRDDEEDIMIGAEVSFRVLENPLLPGQYRAAELVLLQKDAHEGSFCKTSKDEAESVVKKLRRILLDELPTTTPGRRGLTLAELKKRLRAEIKWRLGYVPSGSGAIPDLLAVAQNEPEEFLVEESEGGGERDARVSLNPKNMRRILLEDLAERAVRVEGRIKKAFEGGTGFLESRQHWFQGGTGSLLYFDEQSWQKSPGIKRACAQPVGATMSYLVVPREASLGKNQDPSACRFRAHDLIYIDSGENRALQRAAGQKKGESPRNGEEVLLSDRAARSMISVIAKIVQEHGKSMNLTRLGKHPDFTAMVLKLGISGSSFLLLAFLRTRPDLFEIVCGVKRTLVGLRCATRADSDATRDPRPDRTTATIVQTITRILRHKGGDMYLTSLGQHPEILALKKDFGGAFPKLLEVICDNGEDFEVYDDRPRESMAKEGAKWRVTLKTKTTSSSPVSSGASVKKFRQQVSPLEQLTLSPISRSVAGPPPGTDFSAWICPTQLDPALLPPEDRTGQDDGSEDLEKLFGCARTGSIRTISDAGGEQQASPTTAAPTPPLSPPFSSADSAVTAVCPLTPVCPLSPLSTVTAEDNNSQVFSHEAGESPAVDPRPSALESLARPWSFPPGLSPRNGPTGIGWVLDSTQTHLPPWEMGGVQAPPGLSLDVQAPPGLSLDPGVFQASGLAGSFSVQPDSDHTESRAQILPVGGKLSAGGAKAEEEDPSSSPALAAPVPRGVGENFFDQSTKYSGGSGNYCDTVPGDCSLMGPAPLGGKHCCLSPLCRESVKDLFAVGVALRTVLSPHRPAPCGPCGICKLPHPLFKVKWRGESIDWCAVALLGRVDWKHHKKCSCISEKDVGGGGGHGRTRPMVEAIFEHARREAMYLDPGTGLGYRLLVTAEFLGMGAWFREQAGRAFEAAAGRAFEAAKTAANQVGDQYEDTAISRPEKTKENWALKIAPIMGPRYGVRAPYALIRYGSVRYARPPRSVLCCGSSDRFLSSYTVFSVVEVVKFVGVDLLGHKYDLWGRWTGRVLRYV